MLTKRSVSPGAGLRCRSPNAGKPPPDVTGLDVAIVDFSYKRPVMIELARKAKSILVLDHHKTAEAELIEPCPGIEVHFDMNRSGAVMAWEYFHPGVPASVPAVHPGPGSLDQRDAGRRHLHDGAAILSAGLPDMGRPRE
jgi:hypothetical protein